MSKGARLALVTLVIAVGLSAGAFVWLRLHQDELQASGNKLRFVGSAFMGVLTHQGGLHDPLVLTGDEFTDTYLKLVQAHIDSFDVGNPRLVDSVAALDDTELAPLESKFGKDSRYWELRYCCALHNGSRGEALSYLERARKNGAASANTLLLLHFEHVAKDAGPDSKQELALLGEAIKAGPDEAWTHYSRAIYEIQIAQDANALADIRAGNSAKNVSFPAPFPVSALRERWHAGDRLGNKQCSGAIGLIGDDIWVFLSHDVKLDPRKRNLLKQYFGRGPHDLAELNDWLRFSTRLKGMREFLTVANQSIMVMRIHEAGMELPNLTQAQTENLKRLMGAKDKLRQIQHDTAGRYDPMTGAMPAVARYGARGVFFATGLDEEREVQMLRRLTDPVFADIDQVDLTANSPAPSLGKYEAVTLDVLKQRAAERRAKYKAQHEKDKH
jgi:hypothetical protein